MSASEPTSTTTSTSTSTSTPTAVPVPGSGPLTLAVVVGSVREGRFAPVVARWFTEHAALHGEFTVDVIDLVEHPLPLELPAVPPALEPDMPRPDAMADLTRRLRAADAFVILTPEYNRSFPASVKALIDWHYTEWQAKPVGFVGYSGGSGGLLAIEQLRQVFGELHAHSVRSEVSFPRYYLHFDDAGTLKDPEPFAGQARALLDELVWWASALVEARTARPFPPAA